MKFDREIMKGHLKTIMLAVLNNGPCHAYGFNTRIQEMSLGVFSVPEGTAYPALHKLERLGLVQSTWEKRDKKPDRRVYSITVKGQRVLEKDARDWRFFSRAMSLVLDKGST